MIKTILSIEDDRFTQQLNEIYLTESGFCEQMLQVTSGRQAISFFERIKSGEEPIENFPQILLLDIQMPVMGGWEFLDYFESKFPEYLKKVHIFILTSSINPDDKLKATNDARVVCLLEKPFDFEQIKIAKNFLVKEV